MLASGGGSMLEDCVFIRNSATGSQAAAGGAIATNASRVELVRCLFDRNRASAFGPETSIAFGGAVYNMSSDLDVSHCTFYGNRVDYEYPFLSYGAGIAGTSATVRNSIFWANAVNGDRDTNAAGTGVAHHITYSCMEGLDSTLDDDGNHGMDPLFADPLGGLMRLPAPVSMPLTLSLLS